MTAAARREVLARAVAAWIADPSDEGDIVLEAVLTEIGILIADDEIASLEPDEQGEGVIVYTPWVAIWIDVDGNVMEGGY